MTTALLLKRRRRSSVRSEDYIALVSTAKKANTPINAMKSMTAYVGV